MPQQTPEPPAWEVVSQAETVDLDPSGSFVPGLRVVFRTRSGAVGSVFVPGAEVSVARVRQAIAERAAVLEEIASLRG